MSDAAGIKVIFLGTGGGMTSPGRSLPATLIRICGNNYLVDCGEGTSEQLVKAGFDFNSIGGIFFTHYHGDHISGLSMLAHNMILKRRSWKLDFFGPAGIEDVVFSAMNMNYALVENSVDLEMFDLCINELGVNDVFSSHDFRVDGIWTEHGVESVGYLFTQYGEPDKKVFISGDTTPEHLVPVADEDTVDLWITEASYAREYKKAADKYGHSCAGDAAKQAAERGAKMLALHHISPLYKGKEKLLLDEAKAEFDNVFIANDLQEVII
jgi:ribonuclease Z